MLGLGVFGLIITFYALLCGTYLDGYSATEPMKLIAFVQQGDGQIWFYRPIAWAVPILWYVVLVPLTYTRWWKVESERWGQVFEAVITGTAACSCCKCDPEGRIRSETGTRYGLLMHMLGAMLVIGSVLQQAALAEAFKALSEHQAAEVSRGFKLMGMEIRASLVACLMTGIAIIIVGLLTPGLWSRPAPRVWIARLTMACILVTFLLVIIDQTDLNRLVLMSRSVIPHREGIVAILFLSGSMLGFMLAGWGFAERSSWQIEHAAPKPFTVIR